MTLDLDRRGAARRKHGRDEGGIELEEGYSDEQEFVQEAPAAHGFEMSPCTHQPVMRFTSETFDNVYMLLNEHTQDILLEPHPEQYICSYQSQTTGRAHMDLPASISPFPLWPGAFVAPPTVSSPPHVSSRSLNCLNCWGQAAPPDGDAPLCLDSCEPFFMGSVALGSWMLDTLHTTGVEAASE